MGRKGEGIRWMLEIGNRRKDKEEKRMSWGEKRKSKWIQKTLKIKGLPRKLFSYLVFYVIYVIRSYGNVKKFSQPFFISRK